ncbi:hypothetical protein I549_5182 [Mycobacterium avium subsp. avium 2285 (R)]|nr:hypothetical protein I549_5182 [Mycobacterium avium subsp. avium 2285 (R)]
MGLVAVVVVLGALAEAGAGSRHGVQPNPSATGGCGAEARARRAVFPQVASVGRLDRLDRLGRT